MKIGLVFAGGGGKGAYQIGVWKAIREMGIEPYVTCVSGTSVGALNAALFSKGNYELAENIWRNISNEDILYRKSTDDFNDGDCFFSQKKLSELIEKAIREKSENNICKKCYVTCRYRDKNQYKYYVWSDLYDIELKKRVLLASAAIPIIYESILIDGERFVDGGANGNNIPVEAIEEEELDCIIVIHLSDKPAVIKKYQGEIVDIFPSQQLGGMLKGTLNFNHKSLAQRMDLGYRDACLALTDLGNRCCMESAMEDKVIRSQNFQKGKRTIKENQYKDTEDGEMVDFKFTNEEARKEYEEKFAKLQQIAEDNSVDSAYLWDATVQKYATKMVKVNNILKSEGISEQITTKMFKDIDTFLKKCGEAEFHLALVGAIKAGKSTLINALLGYEYASTKVTPETASLTKFKKSTVNYVKVSFYSKEEWDALWRSANESKATVFLEEYAKLGAESQKDTWLNQEEKSFFCDSKEELVNEIQKWTSSKSACHYFVKEVEVGLKEFELPEGVVLVDTPGLDDVVEYRSNITREYIDRANAVLVCVKSDALTGQEMATIYSVFANTRYNPEKVYIIATQTDTLNRPRENWMEQQEEWLKYLKGNGAYGSMELAKKNLIPVSAYLFTLLKNYNDFSEDDDRYWELDSIIRRFRVKDVNEKYQELIDFTNITLLKNKMQREIVANHKKLLMEDITGSYELCKESIKETLKKVKAAQNEIIETSQCGIEAIKNKQAEYETKYQEAEQDKKELENLLKRLKLVTTKRADELESAIKRIV